MNDLPHPEVSHDQAAWHGSVVRVVFDQSAAKKRFLYLICGNATLAHAQDRMSLQCNLIIGCKGYDLLDIERHELTMTFGRLLSREIGTACHGENNVPEGAPLAGARKQDTREGYPYGYCGSQLSRGNDSA